MECVVATKTELNNGTSLTPVSPVTAIEPIPTDYVAEAQRGFNDRAKSDTFLGSAVQRVAYGVMVYSRVLMSNHQLGDAVGNTPAREYFFSRCKETLLGDGFERTPKAEVSEKQHDLDVTGAKAASKSASLFGRAFTLAAILSNGGVSYKAFNHKLGNFEVPSRMIAPKDAIDIDLMGRLRERDVVMLDGRGCTYRGKNKAGDDKVFEVNASVDQIWKSNPPPKNSRSTRTKGDDKVTKVVGLGENIAATKPIDMANYADFDVLVYAVETIFCKDTDGDQMHTSDYARDTLNRLNAIAKRLDEIQKLAGYDDGKYKPLSKVMRTSKKEAA